MKPERVRVGVVGLGKWGRHHVRIYHQLPEAELVAVASPNPEEVAEFSARYRVPGFLDHRELVGKVDAVSVVTPTVHHYAIARDLLQAGVHVLVEKPITARVEEARELVELARARDRVLLVGHVERFKPSVEELLGRARDPLFVQARRVRPYQPGRATDVGVVMDLMIHDIDIVLSLTRAHVVRVTGIGARLHDGDEDLAVAHLVLDDGCVASLVASRVAPLKAAEIEVTTAEGSVYLNYLREIMVVRGPGGRRELPVRHEEPLRLELRHFLACVRGEDRPRVPGEAGLEALEVAQRILDEMTVVTPRLPVSGP
ncbi:MAG: Gfo/Idh/MocA family oxidoreductase [Armatimonadota bacterium]|nr:Gfo/Idh/MocA family oxidoreductase [Armatimonadota bacterium]MDW8155457.1 Gfo/Idh/MocA family oxidoreductase [Armatimonadota bacterium]